MLTRELASRSVHAYSQGLPIERHPALLAGNEALDPPFEKSSQHTPGLKVDAAVTSPVTGPQSCSDPRVEGVRAASSCSWMGWRRLGTRHRGGTATSESLRLYRLRCNTGVGLHRLGD